MKRAKAVIEVLRENGLVQGENDLKVIMCRGALNALLADEFLDISMALDWFQRHDPAHAGA